MVGGSRGYYANNYSHVHLLFLTRPNILRFNFLDSGGLDLILMPGLAFTRQGARLGRGKGYYDSYLRRCHDSGVTPRTMALSFREQLVDHVPTGEHDFLVQEVVWATEEM